MNWRIHFGLDTNTAKAVQQKLNELGASPPLAVDGELGPASKAAISAYQAAHGLTVDGIAGPMTLASMGIKGGPGIPTKPATELPDRSTPMAAADVAKAISGGYQKVIGKVPTPEQLNLLVSQSAFETGNFGKAVHNYNFGNKKYSAEDPYFQYFRCNEVIDGVNTWYDPPSHQCKFSAYADPTSAGAAFVSLIYNRPTWWGGLQTGDPVAYADALKAGGYFTGDASAYAAGLSRYFNDYVAIAKQYAVPISIGLGGWLVATIAGGLVYLLLKRGV